MGEAIAESDVLLETMENGIAVMRLNRPSKLNALADATVDTIVALLDEVAASSARVLIITGNGRGFCAGFDLSLAATIELAEGEPEAAGWMRRQERYAGMVAKLRSIPQPVIAAVNGASCGAGFALALGCDLRIAAKSAKFNCAFIKIGMSSCDMGLSYLLPRCIGTTNAFELMLTGRMVFADDAQRLGIVSKVVDDEALMESAVALAQEIVANNMMGVWMTKRGMWANLDSSFDSAIELENRTQILIHGTGDLHRLASAGGFMEGAKKR
ncbi:MAG: enoyl-CoA hydratase/isomerase family protein [Rhodobiaceae bacterium]|nr:enoyl-CoA hydratase/isomerase family protein [Rhodobiaceae bacterium]MCC0054508.1 enoyl-CoA hydratase/isomerase family protein [Rhodobiaceae bacterium]